MMEKHSALRAVADEPLTPCRRLAAVLVTTTDMLALAERGDWDAVAELERSRRQDLEDVFATPVDADAGEVMAEGLAALLHLNDELMARLRAARESVLALGARQGRARSALGEYHEVQRQSV